MKKIIFSTLLILGLSAGFANVSFAQDKKDVYKERRDMNKTMRKMQNEKASKDARNEAKRLTKEGWKAAPGTLPLEKQLDRQFLLQQELASDGAPAYLFGSATSFGPTFDSAKLQASTLARQDLASQIETSVGALITTNAGNTELGPEKATALMETVSRGKQLINSKLGRTIPVLEIYRETPKGREVRIMIAYDSEKAFSLVKNELQKEMEAHGDSLATELDKLLGW